MNLQRSAEKSMTSRGAENPQKQELLSRQRSLEQQRAGNAWDCVALIKNNRKEYGKEYASLAKSAPADIQANGLGQTLAFWRAKGSDKGKPKNNAHSLLLEHVSAWVGEQLKLGPNKDLVMWISKEAGTDLYRRATAEAIAFLCWVKRFAEAELGEAD